MQLSANRLEELKNEVLQRLEQYPGLKEIYSSDWVEEQFRLGPTQGFHPAVGILLGEALAAGIENAWLTVSRQKSPGKIGSRRQRLVGSPGGSWKHNHEAWWSCIAEIYLAAHLVKQGYNVQFQGPGSDLALYETQSELVGHVEVYAPRKTLERLELDDRRFWALQGISRETGLGGDVGTPHPRRAQYGPTALPQAVVEDIIYQASKKRSQLIAHAGWTILAIELAWNHVHLFYTHVLATASVGVFPMDQMPGYVDAIVFFAADLPRGEPSTSRAFANPNSPWAGDPSMARLVRVLDRPLRRSRKRR